ncbi:AmmeMemoRadiSam system protein B [Nitrosomonas sp. Nm166]|uniref:AmmeMemoRadiSam system protein B n=1 Tax=Nitrosomonas sp. Nm166 TaxID=1881054 RepID=UPI0008E1D61E|nr:AmmeMemoRadiSam system protein B [Nitrosomonas sp. Nm166]SFF09670.1 hypothetical protein SAMN05428977_104923 [Nitrosomonas sp. Nm166]
MTTIRSPAVAGLFYPADARWLVQDVKHLLTKAKPHNLKPKVLIVPHAGYRYSGIVAATAYASLYSVASMIERVVLLGPAHRMAIHNLALPGVDVFDTPLGGVKLDTDLINAIIDLHHVTVSRDAHALEHSLEVQLPFLQNMLGNFTLLPLVVGKASAEVVADVLDHVWGGEETLIVISSDLSHYLPYTVAQQMDAETVQSILQLQYLTDYDGACGSIPINGLIMVARKHQLTPHLLDLRNSGDTAGPRHQVVGYTAIAFD